MVSVVMSFSRTAERLRTRGRTAPGLCDESNLVTLYAEPFALRVHSRLSAANRENELLEGSRRFL